MRRGFVDTVDDMDDPDIMDALDPDWSTPSTTSMKSLCAGGRKSPKKQDRPRTGGLGSL